MKAKKTYRITSDDYVKAVKKAEREIEISMFTKSLPYQKIHKSKKAYSRKLKHKNLILT